MRRLLAALGTAALAAQLSAAEPAPTADELVRRLAAPRFADREAAGRELVRVGEPAVPALRAAQAAGDPEARARAGRLLELIAKQSESARLTAGKLVKLDFENRPLAEVVAELRKRTGIPIQLEKVAEPARTVTLTGGDVPAWEAVDRLCLAANLREDHRTELPVSNQPAAPRQAYYVNPYGQANPTALLTPSNAPILLTDGRPEPAPGPRGGGVRVLVLGGRFPANRLARGAGRATVTLDVAPLPHLNWQGATAVRVTRAEDEDGRPLFTDLRPTPDGLPAPWEVQNWGWGGRMFVGAGGQVFFLNGGEMGSTEVAKAASNPRLIPVPLRTDDRAVRRLRRLEGVVTGEVQVPNVPVIEVGNLAAAVGAEYPGPNLSKLAVVDYKPGTDGAATLRVRAETPQPWVLQQLKGGRPFGGGFLLEGNVGGVVNQLKFYDAAGRLLPAPRQNGGSYTGDGFKQSYETVLQFPKGSLGPPVRMVQVGTKTVSVEVPFRADDVKLP